MPHGAARGRGGQLPGLLQLQLRGPVRLRGAGGSLPLPGAQVGATYHDDISTLHKDFDNRAMRVYNFQSNSLDLVRYSFMASDYKDTIYIHPLHVTSQQLTTLPIILRSQSLHKLLQIFVVFLNDTILTI